LNCNAALLPESVSASARFLLWSTPRLGPGSEAPKMKCPWRGSINGGWPRIIKGSDADLGAGPVVCTTAWPEIRSRLPVRGKRGEILTCRERWEKARGSVRGTGKPRDERMLPSKSWHSGSVEELKSIRRSWSSSGRVARLSGVAWSFGTRSIRGNSIHPLLANSARAFLKFFSSLFIVLIFSARAFKCRVFSQCLSTSPTPSASAALLCLRTRSRANIGDIRGTRIVTRVFAAHRCIPPVPCLYSSTEWTGPQRPWQEGRGSSGSLRPRRP